jgi:hypothetical protein
VGLADARSLELSEIILGRFLRSSHKGATARKAGGLVVFERDAKYARGITLLNREYRLNCASWERDIYGRG